MLEHRVMEMMVEERIRQSREDAARAQMLRPNCPSSLPRHARLAVSLAAFLIAAGTVIRRRYEPISFTEPETDCSTC